MKILIKEGDMIEGVVTATNCISEIHLLERNPREIMDPNKFTMLSQEIQY